MISQSNYFIFLKNLSFCKIFELIVWCLSVCLNVFFQDFDNRHLKNKMKPFGDAYKI